MTEITALAESVPFDIQSANNGMTFSILHWIGAAGQRVPPWWSTGRDIWLRQFYLRSDYLKIAVKTFVEKATGVPLLINARDHSIKAHVALAEQMQDNLQRNSGILKGFGVEFAKFAKSYCTQDNGAFFLVMGAGEPTGPIAGPAMGVYYLDSKRCMRTGDPEFPVLYYHKDGKRYALHYTRVIMLSCMPSDDDDMLDVGVCPISACIDAAQDMLDISVYNAEKLGSRPPRQLLYAKTGANIKQMIDATRLANIQMDAQGLDRFARTMLLAPATANGQLELDLIDLAAAPDGFDRLQATIMDVAVIASAFGLDPRDLAHSFGASGQTKADAEVMDIKTKGKGVSRLLKDLAEQITVKFLPEALVAEFDYVDDDQDEHAATIRKLRAEGRQIDLTIETITVRVAREQMLSDEEITDEQFEDMELADGRLPDGLDVLMLFQSKDGEISAILSGITDNPLTGGADDALIDERILLAWQRHDAAPNANIKRKMRQAIAALEALRGKGGADIPATPGNDAVALPAQSQSQPVMPPNEQMSMNEQPSTNGAPPVAKSLHTKQDDDLEELMTEYDKEFTQLVSSATNGDTGKKKFQKDLEALVGTLLLAAFLKGSKLSKDEISKAVQKRVDAEIQINLDAVSGLTEDVYAGRYKPDELGEEGASNRVKLWVGGLALMYAIGQMHRADNPYYKWVYGATDHCGDCQRLNGQVHTAQEWLDSGWLPRGRNLECGGFRCQCSLNEVSGPSRGGF